jgi:GR25 family glycosyltransferase involved in LPS biosynthesis
MNNIGFYCLNFYENKREEIKKRFDYLNIDCLFYKGVQFSDERIINDEHKKTSSYTLGQIDMIQMFLNSDYEFGIFCEDDIYINKELITSLPTICNDFKNLNLDILLLGYLLPFKINIYNPQFKLLHNNDNLSYYTYNDDLWGAQMYMYSKKQAKYIIEKYNNSEYLKNKNMYDIPFSSDFILTKDGTNRALITPIMAIEDNSNVIDDYYQNEYHKNCFNCNFDKNLFLPI